MKKIIVTLLLLSTFILAKINAIVSILPEKTFVEAIGGEKVHVALMVLPGNSPHIYEPKPSQMREIANAQLYFAIGVEFENIWLHKFKNLNPHIEVIDLAHNISKLPMTADHHGKEHHHSNNGLDPHIWISPANVKKIAQHIFEALSLTDPGNAHYYKQNLETFLQKVDETDRKIRQILSSTPKGTAFMVFHPSWGYFAHTYGLKQLAVEVEGKAPKPKELIALMKEAKEEKVTAIFTQPEFSDRTAEIIAKELHLPVIKVSPLAADWSDNLVRIAKAIAGEK